MALKTRLRRALGRPSPDSTRTSSTSSSSSNSATDLHHVEHILTSTPSNLPAITLTKTSSRLSKITSWRTKDKKWVEPKSKYPSLKNREHQEMLSGFEMKFGRSVVGRPSLDGRWSIWSGVSPMASRNCSVDLERESAADGGALSRKESLEDLREVETVTEV